MTACETCWAAAQQDVMLLGGSVVDRYRQRIDEANGVPHHARPDEREDKDDA